MANTKNEVVGIPTEISVGTVTTLPTGSSATVTNTGSDNYHAVLNFGIPMGPKGDTGPQGPAGQSGGSGGDESLIYFEGTISQNSDNTYSFTFEGNVEDLINFQTSAYDVIIRATDLTESATLSFKHYLNFHYEYKTLTSDYEYMTFIAEGCNEVITGQHVKYILTLKSSTENPLGDNTWTLYTEDYVQDTVVYSLTTEDEFGSFTNNSIIPTYSSMHEMITLNPSVNIIIRCVDVVQGAREYNFYLSVVNEYDEYIEFSTTVVPDDSSYHKIYRLRYLPSDAFTCSINEIIRYAELSTKADITSPTFAGTPKAPTPTVTDNSTQIATTSFVQSLVAKSAMNIYGTCSTAASTAAKQVSVSNNINTLNAGIILNVLFTYANTAASPTLTIQSSDKTFAATSISMNNVSFCYWNANSVVQFVYDGTKWICVSSDVQSTAKFTLRSLYVEETPIGDTFLRFDHNGLWVGPVGGSSSASYLSVDFADGVMLGNSSSGHIIADLTAPLEFYYGTNEKLEITSEYNTFTNSNITRFAGSTNIYRQSSGPWVTVYGNGTNTDSYSIGTSKTIVPISSSYFTIVNSDPNFFTVPSSYGILCKKDGYIKVEASIYNYTDTSEIDAAGLLLLYRYRSGTSTELWSCRGDRTVIAGTSYIIPVVANDIIRLYAQYVTTVNRSNTNTFMTIQYV